MESQLSRITGLTNGQGSENLTGDQSDEHTTRSSEHVEDGQQAMTQLNLGDILQNNNEVSPRQIGQILRALGDELNDAFKLPMRSCKNG